MGEAADVQPLDGEAKAADDDTANPRTAKADKSSRQVIRELDEKIAKYKQFLDRAKCKRFSAIRVSKEFSDQVLTNMKTKEEVAAQAQLKAAIQRSKKRKAEQDEGPSEPTKLTSKQRRAMERAKKTKKIGARYYETHNVKNKNKNRKLPAAATEGRKAKRSKH